jgi:hypothetical protein
VPRVARIVRHHADRCAVLVQLAEQLHHGLAAFRIEIAGWFVGEQNRRLAGDRPGDRHPLLLSPGQLPGQVAGAMRHADPLERLRHAPPPVPGTEAAIGERQLDVLADAEIADQVEALKDEPDFTVADARPLGGRELRDLPAVQPIRSGRRRVEQAENRQQRRLAAAGRPLDRNVFAARDLQGDVGQRVGVDFVRRKHLGDSPQLDDRQFAHLLASYCSRTRSTESHADMSDRTT